MAEDKINGFGLLVISEGIAKAVPVHVYVKQTKPNNQT